MESSETLFSEPYILTPYKVCVANYLLSYFEEKNHQSALSSESTSHLNIASHCYLSFKLMMALDCSYSEFRAQIFNIPGCSHTLLRRFDQHLSKIKCNGIGAFYDFFLKLSRIVQRKFNLNKSVASMGSSDEMCRVHRSSIAGFFLRKLIIYFERLDYWEMSILYQQLQQYLNNRSEKELTDLNDDFMQIDANITRIDGRRFKSKANKLADLERSNAAADSSAMDLDESMEISVDNRDNDSTLTKCPMVPAIEEGYNFERSLLAKLYPKDKLRHHGQATHHFLTNQLRKIIVNEPSALSPPKIIDFINSYFEQHNTFHYVRLIKSNYQGNLSLVKDSAQFGSSWAAYYNINPLHVGNKPKDFFQLVNCYGDIHYLKYINSLRVNNFTLAQEAFYTYFDLKKINTISSGAVATAATTNTNGANNANANLNNNGTNGSQSSSGTSFCWSVLNLAIMHVHFGHFQLAYEALTDCISVAREKRDEKCLQFAMIWMLLVLQHFDQSSSVEGDDPATVRNTVFQRNRKPFNDISLMENLINLVLSNEKTLPYIAAMAHLHLERLHYLRPSCGSKEASSTSSSSNLFSSEPKRAPLTTRAMLLVAKHLMDDVLMKAFVQHAAIMNAYGAHHLAALMSDMLLALDSYEMVGDEVLKQVNEDTTIAIRNLAIYECLVRGNFESADNFLHKFRSRFSKFNRRIRMVFDMVTNEIHFRRFLYMAEYESALRCVNVIRCIDRNQALTMLAELRWRQNEPIAALECLDAVYMANVTPSGQHSMSGVSFLPNTSNTSPSSEYSVVYNDSNGSLDSSVSVQKPNKPTNQRGKRATLAVDSEEERPLTSDQDPYLVVRCALLKATILSDMSALLECALKAQSHGFQQLQCEALLEVARVQQQVFAQYSDSQNILDMLLVRLLSNGVLADIGTAYLLTATNHFHLHRKGIQRRVAPVSLRSERLSSSLEVASWANRRAILVWERIKHLGLLLESLQLAALIEHEANNLDSRNLYAKRARALQLKLTKVMAR